MTGEHLKNKLLSWNIVLADLAGELGYSPQAFHSKFDSNDLKYSFIAAIAKAIKKSVYELIEEQEPVRKTTKSSEPDIIYTTPVTSDDIVRMPILDLQLAAGASSYPGSYLETVDTVTIPRKWIKKGKGTYTVGRVKGDSMSPTLLDSGYVVLRMLEKPEWRNMPNENIYAVVSKDGGQANAQLKRVKNRIEKGYLVMMSDNPDKASYPNFNLEIDEVISVWHVEWYFTSRMPNIHDQYYSRLQNLEDRFDELMREIKPIRKT